MEFTNRIVHSFYVSPNSLPIEICRYNTRWFSHKKLVLCIKLHCRWHWNNIHSHCNIWDDFKYFREIILLQHQIYLSATLSDLRLFAIIYSSLSFSISLILCSSLDIGPHIILSFLIGWSPELMELSRMLACPKYCSFVVWRRVWVVLYVASLEVSRTQAKSGRSAGRHAARIPTLISTLATRLVSRD